MGAKVEQVSRHNLDIKAIALEVNDYSVSPIILKTLYKKGKHYVD